MIRRFLFILFLYVLLVWLIAALFYSADSKRLVDHGILWTAMGVGALLLGFIVERLVTWWRQRKAAISVNSEAPVVTARIVHEDDAALMNLLREADEKLAQAPTTSSGARTRLRDLPLFLVLGPEGAGKTAVLENSGIEPSLLAGQVLGSGAAITSTRVANVWLAGQSAFLEVSGRVFGSEPDRLAEFISVLKPGGKPKGWRGWFQLFRKPISLRAVLLCVDSRDFGGTAEPSVLDRAAQKIRERLLAISGVLGTEFPVYVLLTKLDGLLYFGDYFARMSEDESGQVFGVLRNEKSVGENENRVWAEAETKRLNRAFQSLFGRLSDRRLLALRFEPDPSNKPAIYEFPREFKRIRTPLVQFLVDVFRPDPLKVTPRLRGFFFVGTKKVERMLNPAEEKSTYSPSFDATQIFKPGMRVIAGDPPTSLGKATASAGHMVERWVFLTELFHTVLTGDRPAIVRMSGWARLDRYRKQAMGVAVGVGAFLILVWTISWIGNWRLSARVESSITPVERGTRSLSLANLRALDGLRAQLEQIDKSDSLRLHWGLYEGDALRGVAQRVYFDRLKQLSLDLINQTLVGHLQRAVPEAQPPGATYDRLKTHLTIATLACSVDRPLISTVLKTAAAEAHPGLGGDQMGLLQSQLDFYAAQLERSNRLPVRLAENLSAVEDARSYLRNAGGLEQQLRSLLNQLNQQVKPVSVTGNVEDYRSVLNGNADVPGAFTKRGYELFGDLAAKVGNSGGEACVMGTRDRVESPMNAVDSRTRERLKSLYLREYVDAWKAFLASYSVIPYHDARDAVTRLGKLSDSQSPLMEIVQLVAVNTSFPAAKSGELGLLEKGAEALGLNRAVDAKKKAEKAAIEANQFLETDRHQMTSADVALVFQPVIYTTPPDAHVLVNDHNGQYIDGLRKLQAGFEGLMQASASEKPAAIAQARGALEQARNARAALADKFNNIGSEGLNRQLEDLLDQPIREAGRHIPPPPPPPGVDKNRELAQFCRDMAPILNKYPFKPASTIEASKPEVSNAFAPMTGKVWKYVLDNGADLVVRAGTKWDRNPSWQGPRVTQDLVNFLIQAQLFTNALFTEAGALQPKLKYTLRPTGAVPVHLVLDGTELRSSQSSLRKDFYWPAQDAERQGAEGTVDVQGGAGFGRFDGLWGVFHLFQNADERALLQAVVTWSENRGRGGAVLQKINPPARVEFVEFPGGVDLFNPKFFEGLSCPSRAVNAN